LGDDLDPAHHIFRYVGGGSIEDGVIDSSAFRRKKMPDGTLESGLSVNWVEWFNTATPAEALQPLRDVFVAKKRSIGATAECAMLNVGAAKEAASRYADVSVILNAEPIDKSHSLVTGYADALNDQVAEQLQTAISARYPARAAKSQS
jgi:hypothetical protein